MLEDIPVLLISFNRPEMTLGSIKNIKLFRPKKVYFSVDGPRKQYPYDLEKVRKCQELSKKIDWDCEVIEMFSEVNFGSGEWPYRSISKALEIEERILIIEDDVRISPEFYKVLRDLMIRYEENKEVFAICASNISQASSTGHGEDYFFTRYFSGWGWATWANRWENYDFIIPKENKLTFWFLLKENRFNILVSLYFYLNMYLIKIHKLRAWDYQVNHMIFKNKLLNVKMTKNLSTNEGIGLSATHTKFMPKLEIREIDSQYIRHPVTIMCDNKQDQVWRKNRMRFLLISWLKRFFKR